MQKLLYGMRHALPFAFLGYAAFVNLQIFGGPEGLGGSPEGDVVTGARAASLNDLYAAAQPHRPTAVSLVGAGRYLLVGEGRDGVTIGRDAWLFSDEEMQAATPALIDEAIAGIAAVDRRLAALGADLVVVPVPAKIDIYRDRGSRAAGAAMQGQYEAFHDALTAKGIETVDTRPALADVQGDAPLYLTSDTHWTPHGARRVAERVAQSGLIAQGDTVFEKVPARPEEFVGDLVSFVTSDEIAPRIGLGPERVTPYVAEEPDAAQGGIFASDAAPVDTVLIGTSYSANPAWSFLPALKIALGRDILNLAQEGRGPVAPMRDFLSEPRLAEEPPNTVIWEYPVRYLGVAPDDAPQLEEKLDA